MARGQLAQRYSASNVAMCNEERGPMATPSTYSWRRDKDGLGVWEHRGKVAVAGYGHSPVDRRWDGTSMDKTLGAYSILACQKAMDDAASHQTRLMASSAATATSLVPPAVPRRDGR